MVHWKTDTGQKLPSVEFFNIFETYGTIYSKMENWVKKTKTNILFDKHYYYAYTFPVLHLQV